MASGSSDHAHRAVDNDSNGLLDHRHIIPYKYPIATGFERSLDSQSPMVTAARRALVLGAGTPHMLAAHIIVIDADFDVDGPPELLDALRTISDRCHATTRQR